MLGGLSLPIPLALAPGSTSYDGRVHAQHGSSREAVYHRRRDETFGQFGDILGVCRKRYRAKDGALGHILWGSSQSGARCR